MLQRNWFFWMEALQITAAERRVVLVLMSVLMVITAIRTFFPARTIYDESYYEPVIAEFIRLSGLEEEDRRLLLARYYPPAGRKAAGSNEAASEEALKVNIQLAGPEELVRLPGIGPVTAGRIIAYRENNGPFRKPEDLLNVSGIGPVTLERIREFIIVKPETDPGLKQEPDTAPDVKQEPDAAPG